MRTQQFYVFLAWSITIVKYDFENSSGWRDKEDASYSVSREVSHSVLKCKTVLGTLDATPKVPLYTDLTRGDTEVSGTTSSEAFLLS